MEPLTLQYAQNAWVVTTKVVRIWKYNDEWCFSDVSGAEQQIADAYDKAFLGFFSIPS